MSKPGRRCLVCSDIKQRALIEIGLASGVPLRTLAERHGISHFALGRHGRHHMSAVQRAAMQRALRPSEIDLEQLQATESAGIVGEVVQQRARLFALADALREAGDLDALLRVEREIGSNIQLSGRLLGKMIQKHEVLHTSLLLSPDYVKARHVMMQALRPFPEAARAVAAAMQGMEADAAKDVTPARPAPRTIDHAPAAPMPAIVDLPPPPPPPPAPPERPALDPRLAPYRDGMRRAGVLPPPPAPLSPPPPRAA